MHLYIYTVTAPENNASGRQRMSACMITTVFINTTSSACGHFPPRVCVRVTYICTCTDVHYISRVTYIFHFSIEKHYTMIPTACSCASCAAGSVKTRPAAVRLYSDCTGKQCNPPCFWTHASAWSLVLQCIYACSMTATLSTSSAYRHSLPPLTTVNLRWKRWWSGGSPIQAGQRSVVLHDAWNPA